MIRARQFLRALRGRCPLCGTRWPRRGRVGLAARCPVCQVHLDRHENDSFLGAYTLNLFATLGVAVLATVANVRWLEASGLLRYAVTFAVIAAFAVWFYRGSKLLWLAVDVQFRPPGERDFDDPEDAIRKPM